MTRSAVSCAMKADDWLGSLERAVRASSRGLTFLQSLDLLLREARPVPLQLPLELQPQLRLLSIIPLHGDPSHLACPCAPCLAPHAALSVQQTALRH